MSGLGVIEPGNALGEDGVRNRQPRVSLCLVIKMLYLAVHA